MMAIDEEVFDKMSESNEDKIKHLQKQNRQLTAALDKKIELTEEQMIKIQHLFLLVKWNFGRPESIDKKLKSQLENIINSKP